MKEYKVLCAITKKHSCWGGRAIPINGKPHTDPELGVNWEHYHIDWRYFEYEDRVRIFLQASPGLGTSDTDYYFVVVRADEVIRLETRRMLRYDLEGFEPARAFAQWLLILEKNFAGVKCKGNRCPHRGADLTNCIPNENGQITCPYHAMIIDKKTMTVVPHFTKIKEMKQQQSFIERIRKLESEL